jgi:hypothetical protein
MGFIESNLHDNEVAPFQWELYESCIVSGFHSIYSIQLVLFKKFTKKLGLHRIEPGPPPPQTSAFPLRRVQIVEPEWVFIMYSI